MRPAGQFKDTSTKDLELKRGEGFGAVQFDRPSIQPTVLDVKIYIYGYLNRAQLSRGLEREAQRNIELVWLTGRLMPDFRTIADFRRDNGGAIRQVAHAHHAGRINEVEKAKNRTKAQVRATVEHCQLVHGPAWRNKARANESDEM